MRNRCIKVLLLLSIGIMATPFLRFNNINIAEVTHIHCCVQLLQLALSFPQNTSAVSH